MALISASVVEIVSVARGWSESKARIRFIEERKNGLREFECSVHSATEDAILLLVSGQPRGVVKIELSDCEFFFGEDDIPSGELLLPFKFGTGISIITGDADSLWLLEVLDGPSLN